MRGPPESFWHASFWPPFMYPAQICISGLKILSYDSARVQVVFRIIGTRASSKWSKYYFKLWIKLRDQKITRDISCSVSLIFGSPSSDIAALARRKRFVWCKWKTNRRNCRALLNRPRQFYKRLQGLKKVYKKVTMKSRKWNNKAARIEIHLKPFLYRLGPFLSYTEGGYNIQLIPMKIPSLHFHLR